MAAQYITDNGEGGPCARFISHPAAFCQALMTLKIIAVTRALPGPDHSARLMTFRRQIGRRQPGNPKHGIAIETIV
ncbi:Uncharacterised protein [Salmonella enterica subsp. enterica]|uniref:Uncharacterized protein n=1 Tax=Salmonella enterica I TaxID=59201 RepID=A0A3S4INZ0_SALET|nr:Uncharacterised protein [Salmonella enterica subsp. enterica]